jgi:hypothetical protein
VHEDVAGRQSDDDVGRHAAVGAADPEEIGVLALAEPAEEVGLALNLPPRPGTVVVEELGQEPHR